MRTFPDATSVVTFDIAERKFLLGLTEAHEHAVATARPRIAPHVDAIVDELLREQMAIPAVRKVVDSNGSLQNLKRITRIYVLDLFGGTYGPAYVKTRRRVGGIHAAVGIPVRLYVSALHLLETLIARRLDTAWTDPLVFEGLHKLFMLDIQFALDTFIDHASSGAKVSKPDLTAMVETTVAERTAEIERLAHTDHLTGLLNRRAFVDHLHCMLGQAEANAAVLSLIFVDLDAFKKVNDAHGHQEGDRILELIGKTLLRTLSTGHRAYRYGGDEFCLLMPGVDAEQAEDQLARLNHEMQQAICVTLEHSVSYSFGIATAQPGDYPDPRSLLATADAAMYKRKAKAGERLWA